MIPVASIQLAASSLVVVLTLGAAIVVVVAAPRRTWNQWLAFFLALVALSYLSLAATATVTLARDAGALTGEQAADWRARLRSAGSIAQLFDAAALAYFACIFPRRNGLATRAWAAAALGAAIVLLTAAEIRGRLVSGDDAPLNPVRVASIALVAGLYAFAVLRLAKSAASEPSTIMGAQLRVVSAGVAIAMLPRVALASYQLSAAWSLLGPRGPLLEIVARVALLWALVLGVRAVSARFAVSDWRRHELRAASRWVAFAALAFSALWIANRVAYLLDPARAWSGDTAASVVFIATEQITYAVRWIAFTAAIVWGVVRYQVIALDRKARGHAFLAALGLGTFALVAVAAAFERPVVAATLSVGLFALGARTALAVARPRAERRFAEYLRERSLEVYRASLAAAIAQGTAEGDSDLGRLRERLRISAREHDALLAIARAEERRSVAPPTMIGRYEVVRRLGAGGYATVFLAKDRRDGRLVALKRLHGAADSALRELEVARRLSHPSLVAIHDVVRLDDGALVVMEFATGGSLRDLIERESALAPRRVAQIARDVLAALDALHEAGLAHGDVKPENVLLDRDGRALLADFGTAHGAASRTTVVAGGASAGTPAYMAPERARGGAPTAVADLYAVGVLVEEALLGARRAGTLRGEWAALVAKATADDPRLRYRTAPEMREALDGLLVAGDAVDGARAERTEATAG